MTANPSRAGLGALKGGLDRFQELGRARRVAAVASGIWAVLVLAYAVGFFAASQARGTAALDAAFFAVTLALPLILIWLAAFLAEALERQRELIAALAEVAPPLFEALEATRATLERNAPASPAAIAAAARDAVREALRAAPPPGGADGAALARVLEGQAAIAARLDALLAAADERGADPAPRGEAEGGAPQPRRRRMDRAPVAARAAAAQPALPHLGGEAPEAPLPWPDLVRALDFPRDAGDKEGFEALKRALRRRSLAQMLQAAEDVLTLLSQEGVYMDDLAFEPADASAWRRFAAGGRDGGAAELGGPVDAEAIETARGLMKSDPIFRDTALFFQRRFDRALGELADSASDAELAELADTRSGRAFRLMLRASAPAV